MVEHACDFLYSLGNSQPKRLVWGGSDEWFPICNAVRRGNSFIRIAVHGYRGQRLSISISRRQPSAVRNHLERSASRHRRSALLSKVGTLFPMYFWLQVHFL